MKEKKNSPRSLLLVIILLLSGTSFAQDSWTLKDCIQRGWERNLDIQRSNLLMDLSKADLKQAKFSRLPSLNGGATHGYNWGQTIDPFTNEFATDRVRNNNFFLSSDVTLFSGFQIHNSIKQGQFDLEASEEDLQRTRNDIGLLIASSFLNVLFSKEQARASEAQVQISERQVMRMERLVEAGQEAEARLLEVQSQLASDQLSLTQIENSLQLARIQLGNLMLLSPEEMSSYEITGPASVSTDQLTPPPSVNEIYQTAVSALPQIKAAGLRVQSSEVGIEVARGGRSPQLLLRGSIGSGYSGNNLIGVGDLTTDLLPIGFVESSLDPVVTARSSFSEFKAKEFEDQLQDNFNQSLSFSLNIPLFNGLSTTSNVSRAKINYQIAKVEEESSRNQLLQDIQQAHADAIAAKRSSEAAQIALAFMTQNFDNAEKRFEQDLISIVDFNDTKSRLAMAEAEAIRARFDYIFRMTIIDFYMGKPINLE